MPCGLYQFCLPFLFQLHKTESRLIKIKWSELTSHFTLHLWSVCFQIYSDWSNFSKLTLVQFTQPPCQAHRSKQHLSKDSFLSEKSPTFPLLSMLRKDFCFVTKLVKKKSKNVSMPLFRLPFFFSKKTLSLKIINLQTR